MKAAPIASVEARDATSIATALRNRLPVPDAQFDLLFPPSQRQRSRFHWTPVDVALCACAMLAPEAGMRVLDVGSGVGKLCLLGALTTGASWVGIERDVERVRVADAAARLLGVASRVQFHGTNATTSSWVAFDAIYLYNPFVEGLLERDLDPMSRRERYVADIARAQQLLVATTPGTRVVTFHGFGADMPDVFDRARRDPSAHDELCLWIRSTRHDRAHTPPDGPR